MHRTSVVVPRANDRPVAASGPFGRSLPALLAARRAHPLDFVQADFSLGNRNAAAEILFKYVLSHPAMTCAIPGTTSVTNLETNLRAARGSLPDAALRRRMEDDWDALAL